MLVTPIQCGSITSKACVIERRMIALRDNERVRVNASFHDVPGGVGGVTAATDAEALALPDGVVHQVRRGCPLRLTVDARRADRAGG